jgi:DNA-binding NtrC family response regulator
MGLPDMDGAGVLAAIEKIDPSLPVILSTGQADRDELEHLLNRPNVGFLLKPYESDVLIAKLAAAIARQ